MNEVIVVRVEMIDGHVRVETQYTDNVGMIALALHGIQADIEKDGRVKKAWKMARKIEHTDGMN